MFAEDLGERTEGRNDCGESRWHAQQCEGSRAKESAYKSEITENQTELELSLHEKGFPFPPDSKRSLMLLMAP